MLHVRSTANVLGVLGLGLLSVAAAHVSTGISAQINVSPIPARSHTAIPARSGVFEGSRRRPRRRSVLAGQSWGRIEIPRVGLDVAVFEGVTDATLRKGPGHVPDSGTPGSAAGNCVIAGHRNSFFRRLATVRRGDLVFVRDLDGTVTGYRLEARRVVRPEEVSVMDPTEDRRLTLITCYPFHFVGPAPYRLVWVGVAVSDRSLPSASSGGVALAQR